MLNKQIIMLFCTLTAYASALDVHEKEIEISPITHQVHSRFYVIKRLKKTIQAMHHLHTSCQISLAPKIIAHLQTLDQFQNSIIKKCVEDLIKTKSLQPLFACWQLIVTYKQTNDPSLAKEFSQLVHFILRQLVQQTKSPQVHSLKKFILKEAEEPIISTYQVSFRFYLLKRLTKSFEIIESPNARLTQPFPNHLVFTHPRTANCYAKVLKKNSIAPILKLFHEIQQYRFINDTLCMQEFLQLLFIAHIYLQEHDQAHEFAHSFEHISTLSITELLESIDIQISKQDHKNFSIPIMLEENFDFSPNHFVQYVYRRFYFIHRLERIINLFKEIDRSLGIDSANDLDKKRTISFDPSTMFNFNDSFTFAHTRIQESIRTMEQDRNLKPLFAVWNDFITYKSIADELFVEEYTKEIFVISRNMLICSGICTLDAPNLRSTNGLCANELLDVIDTYMEQFLEHQPLYDSPHLQTAMTPLRMPDLQPSVHIDDIILRFYHIQRLGIIFWLLNEIHTKAIPLHLTYTVTPNGILIDSYHFTHEHIVSSIKIMEQTQSIEPLMGLLKGVQGYKYIDDKTFTSEYLALTLITLNHLKIKRLNKGINQTLSELPLEKILEALDIIAEELPVLLEKYELNSTISWKDWFKRYWWAPAIILGTLVVKVYMQWRKIPVALPTPGAAPSAPKPPQSSAQRPQISKPKPKNTDEAKENE